MLPRDVVTSQHFPALLESFSITNRYLIMLIKVNGEFQEVEDVSSVENLLEKLNINETRGLAVAVNYNVVPKNCWSDALIKEKDEILMITATKGG